MEYADIRLIIGLIFWLLAFWLLWKVPLCLPSREAFRKKGQKISVIVPARNEEKNLVCFFQSLQKQSLQPFEVIVADDRSQDQTREVAQGFGAKVIDIGEKPAGWMGKPYACFQAAGQAQGDLFLFLDADTFFEKGGLANIMDCFNRHQGVLSIQPFHKIQRLYENFSAYFNLILMASMNNCTPLGKKAKTIGAFGPAMMISRKDYFAIDGHRAAKGKVLEDLAIGQKIIKKGIPLACFGGKGTLNFRMYPQGIKDLFFGFARSFSSGARNTFPLNLVMVILWIVGSIQPVALIIGSITDLHIPGMYMGAILYVMYGAQIFWMLKKIGNFSIMAALAYPVYLLFFFVVFFYSMAMSLLKKKVSWKGRKVNLN